MTEEVSNKEYFEFFLANDSKYRGTFLPKSWEEENVSKEQVRLDKMLDRAKSTIRAHLPGLKEAGVVPADLTEEKIIKGAKTQFCRKSGLRMDEPHLLPNLFNAYLDKQYKFPEPEIKNPGSGKGGARKFKLEITPEKSEKISDLIDQKIADKNFDVSALDTEIVQIIVGSDSDLIKSEFEKINAALAGVESSEVLTAVLSEVDKIRDKMLKSATEISVSISDIKELMTEECRDKYGYFVGMAKYAKN